MFSTLRVDPKLKCLKGTSQGTMQDRGRRACMSCRERKVRCTGAKDGCQRCLAKGTPCHYPTPPSRRRNVRTPSCAYEKAKNYRSIVKISRDAEDNADLLDEYNDRLAIPYDSPHSREATHDTITSRDTDSCNPDALVLDSNDQTSGIVESPLSWAGDCRVFDGVEAVINTDNQASLFAESPFEDFEFSPNKQSETTRSSTMGTDSESWVQTTALDIDSNHSPGPDYSLAGVSGCHPVISLPTAAHTDQQTPSSITCRCNIEALVLLEKIIAHSSAPPGQSVTSALQVGKHALASIGTMLACSHCGKCSSFLMLLIVVARELVKVYGRVLSQLRLQAQQESFPAWLSQSSSSVEQDRDCYLPRKSATSKMTYDSSNLFHDLDAQEVCCVFGSYAKLHLRRLRAWLGSMRETVRLFDRNTHLRMVDSTCDRIDQEFDF